MMSKIKGHHTLGLLGGLEGNAPKDLINLLAKKRKENLKMFEETNQTEIPVEDTNLQEPMLLPYSLFDREEEEAQEKEPSPEGITVKYNGEMRSLTPDEAKTYAQKGMNYDRIFTQREDAHRALDVIAAQRGVSRNELLAGIKGEKIPDIRWRNLLREYPDLDVKSIPEKVYLQIGKGLTPIEAYQKHLIEELNLKLSAKSKNEENRSRAVGSMASDGKGQYDAFLEGFLGERY